ncbi:aminotransferase class I/II-fold pyridoxal phosphate-dependent enzyme [Thalassiella azotivora]
MSAGPTRSGHPGASRTVSGQRPAVADMARTSRTPVPPSWLRRVLHEALDDLSAHPRPEQAVAALARRHAVGEQSVLVTAGAGEVPTLLGRALLPASDVRRAAVVHPMPQEAERALRLAGHDVVRVVLRPEDGFELDPHQVPDDVDLVLLGNPANPCSVRQRASLLAGLTRAGRVVCVDESFLPGGPGDPGSMLATGAPGVVSVRSLTRTWGVAGLRAGYVVGDRDVVSRMRVQQAPGTVSSLALAALRASAEPQAVAEAFDLTSTGVSQARLLATALRALAEEGLDLHVPVYPQAPFVLVRVDDGEFRRQRMRARGWAIRSCTDFPGLGPDWWRLSARDPLVTVRFLEDLRDVLSLPALAVPDSGW